MEHLVEVKGLKKYYPGKKRPFQARQYVKAVDDVSFYIDKGESFGVVGESGCGKSTLCKTLIRLTEPTAGEIYYDGTEIAKLEQEDLRLLRQRIQIIFQDPYASLNPRMTVRELIKAPLDIFSKASEEEKMEKVFYLMELVGLPREFMNKYPHEFSGGQRQRIMIARALILEPEFVCCDEPVSALDVSVRAQVLNLMKDLQARLSLTYLFISHDLSVVRYFCDRIAVMYLGRIVEIAEKDELYDNTLHPYTKCLISSIPIPDPEVERRAEVLEGDVPSPYNPPSGCHFHTRCKYADKCCSESYPELKEVRSGHFVACHFALELEGQKR